jgi:hypothetical protein
MTHANILATLAFFCAISVGFSLIFNQFTLVRLFGGLFIVLWCLFKLALEVENYEED